MRSDVEERVGPPLWRSRSRVELGAVLRGSVHGCRSIVHFGLAGGDCVLGDVEDREVLADRHRSAVVGGEFVKDRIDAGLFRS